MFTPVFLVVLAALAAAEEAKNCRNITVPLDLSSRNGVFGITVPTTDYRTVNGKYELSTTYCEPKNAASDKLQILTHGIGFDRSYWDYPFDNYNYSYTKRALDRGFATLSWDRLGIAESSHGDPLSEIQMFLEISALKGLTQWVKAGNLPGGRHRDGKMAHVGHSFGSVLTFVLTAENPDISDAIVLQGYSQATSFMAQFILGSDFVPAKKNKPSYTDGYFATQSRVGNMIDFFAPGDFDPKILDESVKSGQPVTVGELLTMGSVPMKSGFKGPVLIVTGERDVPFCGGNCNNAKAAGSNASNILAMSQENFESAAVFNTTVIPGAGHGLNLQYSAPRTYKAMLDFLESEL